jgi:hypothetical protein
LKETQENISKEQILSGSRILLNVLLQSAIHADCITFMIVVGSEVSQTLQIRRVLYVDFLERIEAGMVDSVLKDQHSIKMESVESSFNVLRRQPIILYLFSRRFDMINSAGKNTIYGSPSTYVNRVGDK